MGQKKYTDKETGLSMIYTGVYQRPNTVFEEKEYTYY